jgi:hypothetical protein
MLPFPDNGVKAPIPYRSSSMPGTLLIVALAIAIVATLPAWPYSRRWGYYLSSLLGLLLTIALMLQLMDRI